jgi:hypothetical protein
MEKRKNQRTAALRQQPTAHFPNTCNCYVTNEISQGKAG